MVNIVEHVGTMVEVKVDIEVVKTRVVTAAVKAEVVEEPQGENNERQ